MTTQATTIWSFLMFNVIERVPWKLVDRVRILGPHGRHNNGTCGLTILVLRVEGQGKGKGSRSAAVDSPPVQHSLRKQQHGQQRMQADMALQTTSDTPKSSKRVYLSVLSLDSDVCLFLHLLFDHFWCFCAVLKMFWSLLTLLRSFVQNAHQRKRLPHDMTKVSDIHLKVSC